MKTRTGLCAFVAGTGLMFAGAMPAFAAVTEDGVYNCAAYPAVQFLIQGGGVVLGPGDGTDQCRGALSLLITSGGRCTETGL